VILGSEERQPLMDDDRPLPFELPAAFEVSAAALK
jgi:hypothetical protein